MSSSVEEPCLTWHPQPILSHLAQSVGLLAAYRQILIRRVEGLRSVPDFQPAGDRTPCLLWKAGQSVAAQKLLRNLQETGSTALNDSTPPAFIFF